MSANKETLKQTVIVALALCIVCSVVVSAAAVLLKPKQDANKKYERSLNVLAASGLYDADKHDKDDVLSLFGKFETKLVDLETGNYLSVSEAEKLNIDIANYDQKAAAKDPALSITLSGDEDIANIRRRAKYASIYVLETDGKIDRMVLPVHGYGLWSTLYGFLAVEGNGNNVLGLTFYAHAETPGLGGEVDNPSWKAKWQGKKIYNANGDVALTVVKGEAKPLSEHEIDGLSGATLTSRGVKNLIEYWMSDAGFGAYLAKVQRGDI